MLCSETQVRKADDLCALSEQGLLAVLQLPSIISIQRPAFLDLCPSSIQTFCVFFFFVFLLHIYIPFVARLIISIINCLFDAACHTCTCRGFECPRPISRVFLTIMICAFYIM